MVKVSAILCSVLVLVAITIAVASDTNISHQIGEFNNKLTYLQGRLDLFDFITEANVPVLQHRVEIDDLKYAENVTMLMNESNENVKHLVDKIDTLATDVCKINDLETKFNVLATTVSSNAENVNVQLNETNIKLNDVEGKLNALTATVTNLVGAITELLLKPLSSCVDAFARPFLNRGSGVYNIQSNVNSPPFDVYCLADPKGGLPWTVVQRRVDGSVDFYRNWTEYQRGFGNLDGNFFFGLDKMHSLTTKGMPQELWVMLTDPDGISAHAYYDRFAIGSEAEKYSLKVLSQYSGDAGISLTFHKSMKFTTYDNDNDGDNKVNCAKQYKSAWWFDSCLFCQLNGVYGSTQAGGGLYWSGFRDPTVSMKYAHMAIRPARK